MSGIDPADPKTTSDGALSAALRDLARSVPQAAPPELGPTLARAFHRHHLRRRITRMTIVSTIAIALCGGLLWLRTADSSRIRRQVAVATPGSNHEPPATAKADSIPARPQRDSNQVSAIRVHRRSLQTARTRIAREEPFVALPAFALRSPDEELHVIRVEMPISSLRLLGAQINDELFTRRVTTDLLIGPDGTPYAFRLIT